MSKLTVEEMLLEGFSNFKNGSLGKIMTKEERTGYITAMGYMTDRRYDKLGYTPSSLFTAVKKMVQEDKL